MNYIFFQRWSVPKFRTWYSCRLLILIGSSTGNILDSLTCCSCIIHIFVLRKPVKTLKSICRFENKSYCHIPFDFLNLKKNQAFKKTYWWTISPAALYNIVDLDERTSTQKKTMTYLFRDTKFYTLLVLGYDI